MGSKYRIIQGRRFFKLEIVGSDENYFGKTIACQLSLEDYRKVVTKFEKKLVTKFEEWRRKTIKEKLKIKINIEHTICIPNTILYKKLENCVAKKKITIIPDANCLYRALSWWLTEREDFHELIREKIVEFMRKSTKCEQYVKISQIRILGSIF